jgi:hypothetical protein
MVDRRDHDEEAIRVRWGAGRKGVVAHATKLETQRQPGNVAKDRLEPGAIRPISPLIELDRSRLGDFRANSRLPVRPETGMFAAAQKVSETCVIHSVERQSGGFDAFGGDTFEQTQLQDHSDQAVALR